MSKACYIFHITNNFMQNMSSFQFLEPHFCLVVCILCMDLFLPYKIANRIKTTLSLGKNQYHRYLYVIYLHFKYQ